MTKAYCDYCEKEITGTNVFKAQLRVHRSKKDSRIRVVRIGSVQTFGEKFIPVDIDCCVDCFIPYLKP